MSAGAKRDGQLSRGIPKKDAQRLVVFGFLNEAFERLGNEPVQEMLRELVRAKLD